MTASSSSYLNYFRILTSILLLGGFFPTLLHAQSKKPRSTTSILYGDAHTKKEDSSRFYFSAFQSDVGKKKGGSSGITEEKKDKPGQWSEEDISRVYPELRVLDNVSSKKSLKSLKVVEEHFKMSVTRQKALEERIKFKRLKWAAEHHPYKWKARDRKMQQDRKVRRMRARFRVKAIGDLVAAIDVLRKIRNPGIMKSSRYLDLKSKIYIQYVKLQFRSKNLSLCIPILEQYMAIKPEHRADPEPHRLLAAGYRHEEKMARQMNNIKAAIYFKRQKSHHLKRFITLKFGENSPQAREVEKAIRMETIDEE